MAWALSYEFEWGHAGWDNLGLYAAPRVSWELVAPAGRPAGVLPTVNA